MPEGIPIRPYTKNEKLLKQAGNKRKIENLMLKD